MSDDMGLGTDTLPVFVITVENDVCATCSDPAICRVTGCQTLIPGMEICDDCRVPYEGPAYYTFDSEACKVSVGDTGFYQQHAQCTGNTCPDCSGPYLMPDDEFDTRRPV